MYIYKYTTIGTSGTESMVCPRKSKETLLNQHRRGLIMTLGIHLICDRGKIMNMETTVEVEREYMPFISHLLCLNELCSPTEDVARWAR